MSFCASCGRQRSGTARFCSGCGAEFGDVTAASGDQEPPAADRADPGATRLEPPAPQTDPFASWYQQQPSAGRADAGSTWQPTQTVHAGPTQPPGYPSSGFNPANPFSSANPVTPTAPPAPPTGPPASGGRRGLFIAAAVVVVLGAGGGAYALASSLGKHSTAQPTVQPTGQPTGGAPAAASTPPATPATPASSPASSATATPSPTLSLVAIAPSVTSSAAEPQVETLLSHYFHGINNHSYPEYVSTLNPAQQARQTRSQFDSGYSTTSDSGMTLTSLSHNGSGGLTSTVTFTSHQSAAQSVDNSTCNAWTLNLYLVPQGNGYLIGPAPSGYRPSYSDC